MSLNVRHLQSALVLVIGDLILDEYIEGSVQRISPEAPVPIFLESHRRHVLGGAGNVAANISQFGAKVWVLGRLGQDENGSKIEKICSEINVNLASIKENAPPTIVKTRVMAGYQQMIRIDKETVVPLNPESEKAVVANVHNFLEMSGPKSVVISDYGKGFFSENLLKQVIALAKAAKVPVVTDPKSKSFAQYAGSTVLKPNRSEAEAALGRKIADVNAATAACSELCQQANIENMVLSLSDKGVVSYFGAESKVTHFPSTVRRVADVSGAGDTMVAFLAMGMAMGWPLSTITQVANEASGVVCSKLGTATLSLEELEEAIGGVKGSIEKVHTLESLTSLVASQKKSGAKIVFTNGCFDLLHLGHVTVLEQARALGEFLVVAVNSDASVKTLKGPTRPLQKEQDRMQILAGLESVSAVVLFSDETPLRLIEALSPDVLVKGGDYEVKSIVGYDHVVSNGGVVVTIPTVEGRSTTKLILSAST